MIDNERPWIGVDTVYTEKLEPGPVIQKAFVRIKNTGKTPALRMRASFKGSVLPKGTPPTAPDVASESPKPLFPDIPDFYHPFADSVCRTPISKRSSPVAAWSGLLGESNTSTAAKGLTRLRCVAVGIEAAACSSPTNKAMTLIN
jgi:hypothetical protein